MRRRLLEKNIYVFLNVENQNEVNQRDTTLLKNPAPPSQLWLLAAGTSLTTAHFLHSNQKLSICIFEGLGQSSARLEALWMVW